MSRVKGRNTKPEIQVRKLLHGAGFRFRIHRADLPGRPDIYLPRYRVAILVHGCFWHGHQSCQRAKLPQTHTEFWRNKVTANRERDSRIVQELSNLGIVPVTLWECELKERRTIIAKIEEVTGRGHFEHA